MESDFTTRHHLDSVTPFADPSIGELLLRYRQPPVEPKAATHFAGAESPSQSSSNAYISNMLGQLQGTLQSMAVGNKDNLSGSGLQLSVNADILRWMLVLAFAIVLVIVIFQYMSYRRAKNPLKKRLRRLENELKALRMRKNPALEDTQDSFEEDSSE